MTLVSVVVPAHNAARHLAESLGSIQRQSLTEIEIIVVDDGSTDETAAIIADLAAADSRFRVISGPAAGSAGAARNAGLEQARGDYIIFLDADDFFAPTLLERLHGQAVADDADVTVTRFRVFDERTGDCHAVDWGLRVDLLPANRPFEPQAVGPAVFYALGPVAWNKLFRTEFLRREGIRFQTLRRSNDVYFTFMAIASAQRISYVDELLIDYRSGSADSLQGSVDETPLEFADALTSLQSSLRASGRMDAWEAAFVNEAVEICLSALAKVRTFEAFHVVHHALRTDLLERFGALGRPDSYFVRPELARRLAELTEDSASAYLFGQWAASTAAAARAKADARLAQHELSVRANARSLAAAPPAAGRTAAPFPGQPDVSVVIPVYNTALLLHECIASVQAQTGVSCEVIVVDDGSTDSSLEVLSQFARLDPRIVVLTQPNAGPAAARNLGMARATGRYLCFLDSDDYWRGDLLAQLVDHADRTEVDALLFDGITLREPGISDRLWKDYDGRYRRASAHDGVVSGAELLADLERAEEYRVQPCLYLLRRAFVVEQGLAFQPGLHREDNLFTFAMMLKAQRATHVQTAFYVRRLRPGTLTTAGTRAAASLGYFVNFIEMLRLASRQQWPDGVGEPIGAVLYRVYRQAQQHFNRLDPDLGDSLGVADTQPDAQAVLMILQQQRRDARATARRRPAQQKKVAPSQPESVRTRLGRRLRSLRSRLPV